MTIPLTLAVIGLVSGFAVAKSDLTSNKDILKMTLLFGLAGFTFPWSVILVGIFKKP